MRRPALLVTALVVAVALVGAAVWWALTRTDDVSTSPEDSVTSSAADGPDVIRALSTLADDPAALVPNSLRGRIQGDPATAIPAGSRVDTREDSWAPDGIGGGVIEVSITPPSGPTTRYLAVMVKEEGSWKVLSTVPAR